MEEGQNADNCNKLENKEGATTDVGEEEEQRILLLCEVGENEKNSECAKEATSSKHKTQETRSLSKPSSSNYCIRSEALEEDRKIGVGETDLLLHEEVVNEVFELNDEAEDPQCGTEIMRPTSAISVKERNNEQLSTEKQLLSEHFTHFDTENSGFIFCSELGNFIRYLGARN